MAKLKSLRSLAVAVAAFVAVSGVAFAAGLFQGFPIVGGAAYCLSFVMNPVTGAATTTCNGPQAPAGPTALTGNELIPADTQLAQGQAPQTVLVPTKLLGGGAVQYNAPLTGASLTVLPNETTMLLEPAGTIATLTVTLPAATALSDGQRWRISSTATVTALTLTPGTGTTIPTNPTAITISTTAPYGYEFQYKSSTAKWYRVQ